MNINNTREQLFNLVKQVAPSYSLGIGNGKRIYNLNHVNSKFRIISTNYFKYITKEIGKANPSMEFMTNEIAKMNYILNNRNKFDKRIEKGDVPLIDAINYQILRNNRIVKELSTTQKIKEHDNLVNGRIYKDYDYEFLSWFDEKLLTILKNPDNITENIEGLRTYIKFKVFVVMDEPERIEIDADNNEYYNHNVGVHYTTKATDLHRLLQDTEENEEEINMFTGEMIIVKYLRTPRQKIEKLISALLPRNSDIISKYIVGYTLILNNQQDKDLTQVYAQLKAYKPNINKPYHNKTIASTSINNKLCIYETYLYICKNIDISKNKDKQLTETKLNEEPEELQTYIKNGELMKSLIYLSKRDNTTLYLQFFKNKYNNVKFTNGQMSINNDDLKNKLVFLYDNEHVAPSKNYIYTNKDDEDNKNYVLFKRENKTEKTKNINIESYDIETLDCGDGKQLTYSISFTCRGIPQFFYGIDAINQFVNFLDTIKDDSGLSKTNKKDKREYFNVYSLNGAKYDNYFIFDELLTRLPSAKIIIGKDDIKHMKYHNIRFFDLSLFYNGGLNKVYKSFFGEDVEQKYTFPYRFPSIDNLDYVGKVPDVKYWNSPKDRDAYLLKYGLTFNMKQYTETYNNQDVILTRKIALEHHKKAKGEINGKKYNLQNCPTIGSMAINMFSNVFQEKCIFASPPKQQIKERSSYFGGYNGLSNKYFKSSGDDKLHYIDINSAHAHSMKGNIPNNYKFTVYDNMTKDEKSINDIKDYYLYYANYKYIGNDPNYIPNILSRTSKGDIIAVQQSEYAYIWGCELKEAIRNKCIVNIQEINMYEPDIIFDNYIDHFYNERLQAKKDNNLVIKEFNKQMLTNLYGKFGSKENVKRDVCNSQSQINHILNNEKNTLLRFTEIGEKIMLEYTTEGETDKNIGSLVRIASYTTAQTRCNLSRCMRNIAEKTGYKSIYYWDTDSIFTTTLPDKEFLDNDKLGSYKIEKELSEAIFLAKKTYYADDTNKAKGVNSKSLTRDDYMNLMNNKDESKEILNKTMFFRSLENIHIKEQIRTISTVYDSRIFDGNNSRAYLNINEYNSISRK